MPIKCFNCGEGGHVARECPNSALGPRCYNCDQHGHLASQCGACDPAIMDPNAVATVAQQAGLTMRQGSGPGVLCYEKDGLMYDIFFPSRAVKISSADGSSDFKQQGYSSADSLLRILGRSRQMGGGQRGGGEDARFTCTSCALDKPKLDFSRAQWAKRSSGSARCEACVGAGGAAAGGAVDEEDKKERKPRKRTNGKGPKCFNCGEMGHMKTECALWPSPRWLRLGLRN